MHSHTGHPLNEAADALASLAQRGLPAVETRSRAEGLVEAFLRTWHEQANGTMTSCRRPAAAEASSLMAKGRSWTR